MQNTWRRNYTRYRAFFLDIYRIYKTRSELKMFLEILLSLATISFFAIFALRPTALTITQLIKNVRTKSETVDAMDKKITDLKLAQDVFQKESPRLGVLDEALPENPSPELFARQVEGLSQLHSVKLNTLTINDVQIVGKSQTVEIDRDLESFPDGSGGVNFSINILGTYQNIISFLKDLELLRRPIKIDTANVSVATVSDTALMSLSINGRVPYKN